MVNKMSVCGGGGIVVLVCHLGKSSRNLMSKEEGWCGPCGFVSRENFAKNELILNHTLPQVYRAIALLLIIISSMMQQQGFTNSSYEHEILKIMTSYGLNKRTPLYTHSIAR